MRKSTRLTRFGMCAWLTIVLGITGVLGCAVTRAIQQDTLRDEYPKQKPVDTGQPPSKSEPRVAQLTKPGEDGTAKAAPIYRATVPKPSRPTKLRTIGESGRKSATPSRVGSGDAGSNAASHPTSAADTQAAPLYGRGWLVGVFAVVFLAIAALLLRRLGRSGKE